MARTVTRVSPRARYVSAGSPDAGRFAVTGGEADRGAFKTPSLRNVAGTAPYMHDGSIATLADVIEHYDRGGSPNPRLDEEIRPLRLSAAEKRQLLAFLRALTGDLQPRLARTSVAEGIAPACRVRRPPVRRPAPR